MKKFNNKRKFSTQTAISCGEDITTLFWLRCLAENERKSRDSNGRVHPVIYFHRLTVKKVRFNSFLFPTN